MNKKNIILIMAMFLLGLCVTSGTYAYWTWNSTVNKNVVFNTAGLSEHVVYDEGTSHFVGDFKPSDNFCGGLSTTVSFYKTVEAANAPMVATINMDVNKIESAISESDDVYWVVTSGNNNLVSTDSVCTSGLDSSIVVSYGKFKSFTDNSSFVVASNLEVPTEPSIAEYTVWIWIDKNGTNLSSLSGTTLDTNIWSQIDMVDIDNVGKYTISYYAMGGINGPSIQYKETGVDVTISNVAPARSGYVFVGWNTKSDGTGTSFDMGTIYTVDSNLTLYAMWEKSDISCPTIVGYEGDYDGNAHTIEVSDTSNVTINYSEDNTSWSTTKPTQTDVGTKKIYVRIQENGTNNVSECGVFNVTINRSKTAIPGTCNSGLVYTGVGQTLASGATNATYTNNLGTDAGNYSVNVSAGSNYAFSDGETSKTLNCSIGQITPNISLSATSGTIEAGTVDTFNATVTSSIDAVGILTATSGTTDSVTITDGASSSITATSSGITKTITYKGGKIEGNSTISVTFTPNSTNFKTVTKTFVATNGDSIAPEKPSLISIYDLWGSKPHTESIVEEGLVIGGSTSDGLSGPVVTFSDFGNLTGINGGYILLSSALTFDLEVKIDYTSTSDEVYSDSSTLKAGSRGLYIPFTQTGEWSKIEFILLSQSEQVETSNIEHLGVSGTAGQWNNDHIIIKSETTDAGSGVGKWQYSYVAGASDTTGDATTGWADIANTSVDLQFQRFAQDYNVTLYKRACDKAGNCSSVSSIAVKEDITAPTTPSITTIYDLWGSRTHEAHNYLDTSVGVNGTWTTSSTNPYIIFNNIGNLTGINGVYVELSESLSSNIYILVYYATSDGEFSASTGNYVAKTLKAGETKVYLPITASDDWSRVRFDISEVSGLSYKIKYLGVSATSGQWNNDAIGLRLETTESGSGIASWQQTYSSTASSTGTDTSTSWVDYANSASSTFFSPFHGANKNTTHYLRTCDNTGNCSSKSSVPIKIDATAPTATLSASASGTSVTASLSSVVESGSGIYSYYYAIVASDASCSGYTTSSNTSYTWTGKTNGTYKVCAKLVDKSGSGNSKEYTKTVTVNATKCYKALKALSCNDQPMSVAAGATNVASVGSSYYITVVDSTVTSGEPWLLVTEKYNPYTYTKTSLDCWVVGTSTAVSEYTELGGACYT